MCKVLEQRAIDEGIDLATIDQLTIRRYVRDELKTFWWNCPDQFKFVMFLQKRAEQNIQRPTRISTTN